MEEFARRFRGKVVILDKGYVGKKLSNEMGVWEVKYIVIKRGSMLKSGEEAYYKTLLRIRGIIETRFLQL